MGEHDGEDEQQHEKEHEEAKAFEALEEEQARERSEVRPQVVHEVIRRAGEQELKRSTSALAWSGLAAGLSMGFSLAGDGLLRAHLPDAAWAPLVSHLGYTLGFLFVIIARQQLFTEDTLLAVIPLLSNRDRGTLLHVGRLWLVVLIANLVGAAIFAAVVERLPVFGDGTRSTFLQIAGEAMHGGPAALFLRAIFAGWIIALMVWMLPASEQARVPVVIIMTYVVALGGLPHVIAGAAETLYGLFRGAYGFPDWLLRWFLPTLAGNVVGGVSLVSVVNHAQVVAGERE